MSAQFIACIAPFGVYLLLLVSDSASASDSASDSASASDSGMSIQLLFIIPLAWLSSNLKYLQRDLRVSKKNFGYTTNCLKVSCIKTLEK